MPESRRLAAIMAADVVGYSRLMEDDEVGTVRTLREHRAAAAPSIASHGGRVVKTMGDGLLLEFSSVVAAVECAVALQTLMIDRNIDAPENKRIVYRIGVHLGDILIDGQDILGEGVNIAARLEGIASPGGVCISGSAYDQVRGRIEFDFVDMGNRTLKNIARPVRVYEWALDKPLFTPNETAVTSERDRPPRLSIIVFPFKNMSGDADQEYFADGVTEALTADLSRMSGMLVIGRNTAFTFKGKSVDLRQVGQTLNIRYALEGSIQRASDRIRIIVQLTETSSGHQLWSERFDKQIADFFDMQDEIVARLSRTLDAKLVAAEARRAEHSPNPDALDLCFQGAAWANKGVGADNLARAEGFYQRALDLDNNNVEALIGTAYVNIALIISFLANDKSQRFASAGAALTKALRLAPEHAFAHFLSGTLNIYSERAALGISRCERALEIDRNLAFAHGMIGIAKNTLGRFAETEAHVSEALRLSPYDTHSYVWLFTAASAKLCLSFFQEAASLLQLSIEAKRTFAAAHFYLAAALAHLGRAEDAKQAVQEGLQLAPNFTIDLFRASAPSQNSAYLAGREYIIGGLTKAGVPTG